MERHFQRELESLKTSLIKMGSVVEENIAFAIRSVLEKRNDLTHKVIETDKRVDALEIEIDNAVIDLLALQQPVASDLRFIIAAQKINNDLERIGDLATTIAKQVINLEGKSPVKPLIDIPRMTDLAIAAIKDSLAAIAEWDSEKAKQVITRDSQIDELNIQIFRELLSIMAEAPTKISDAFALIMVARSLERIGDHATNIAERAVYYIEGIDIRHTL